VPSNVRRFAWLWFAANLAAFPEIFLMPPPDPQLAELGLTRPVELMAGAGVSVLLLVLALPFVWFVVWRRKNWARWALFLGFAVSLPFSVMDALGGGPHQFFSSALVLASTALEALAFFFLFTGDAPPWFKRENAKDGNLSAPQ